MFPKIAEIIGYTLVIGAVCFSVIVLTGCATQEEKLKGSKEMAQIAYEFKTFANDCEFGDGRLMIDRPFTERRVQNAPITVWEMKDAICWYEDERYPVRLYYGDESE